jgi:curli biogenesis system outer membrane secretion channel CsgG
MKRLIRKTMAEIGMALLLNTPVFGQTALENLGTGLGSVAKNDIPTEMNGRRVVTSLPKYEGPKPTIGVGEFKNLARSHHGLGENLRTMLESALTQCGRFEVLDRTNLKNAMVEIGLANSGAANGNRGAVKAGQLKSAVFLAHGVITAISEATSKTRAGAHAKNSAIVFGGEAATVSMTIKVTDNSTGGIVIQRDIVGKAKKGNVGAALKAAFLGGAAAHEARNPVEEAAQDCIVQLVDIIAKEMEIVMAQAAARNNMQATVLKVYSDGFVALNIGLSRGVMVGQQFEVAGEMDELGLPVSESSVVRVTYVTGTAAKCEVLNGPAPRVNAVAKLVE